MKPAPFKYHDPRSVTDLTGLLATLENAKLLAGGQSLGPMLNFRFVMPDHLIDLNRIPELAYIRVDKTTAGEGTLEIGAMTRQRALERSEGGERGCPGMTAAPAGRPRANAQPWHDRRQPRASRSVRRAARRVRALRRDPDRRGAQGRAQGRDARLGRLVHDAEPRAGRGADRRLAQAVAGAPRA